MTTLEEKVQAIVESSDFNDLSLEERKRIKRYMDQRQILTIWQMINNDRKQTTEAWRNKQRVWLKNILRQYEKDYEASYEEPTT